MRHLIRLCIDQGLSSLSLFIFSIALARQFGAAGFSTYAIALSSSLMVMAIFNSAYIEPTAFKESEKLSRKTTASLISILTIATSVVCAFFIDASQFISIFLFIAGSSTLFAVRRIKALSGEQNQLTIISTTSFSLTMLSLWLLIYNKAPINVWLSTYGCIGIAYILFIPKIQNNTNKAIRADVYSLSIAIMFWLCSNYFFYYLPAIDRADESGQLRIIYTLFMPILQAGTIAGSIYISKKEYRGLIFPSTLIATIVYGIILIAIGPNTIHKLTNIPISTTELIYATALAVANNSAGLFSISMRMQKLIRPLLISSAFSAILLVTLSFLASDLSKVISLITLSFLASIILSKVIGHLQK